MSDHKDRWFLREPWITFWLIIMAALAGAKIADIGVYLWRWIM